jgi:hypothetical protein
VSDPRDSLKRLEHELTCHRLLQLLADPHPTACSNGDHRHCGLPLMCFIVATAPALSRSHAPIDKGRPVLATPPAAMSTHLIIVPDTPVWSMKPPPVTMSRITTPAVPGAVVTYSDNSTPLS